MQDSALVALEAQAAMHTPALVAISPMSPLGSFFAAAGLLAALVLLMAVGVHVVMSLQKSTTGHSSFWRAIVSAAIATAGAIGVGALLGQLGQSFIWRGALYFVAAQTFSLVVVLRYLYCTTFVRALLSALLSCFLVPLLIMLIFQVVF